MSNGESLTLKEGDFDQINGLLVVDRVPSLQAFCRNIRRLGRDGARFLIGLPDRVTNVGEVGETVTFWDRNSDERAGWIGPDPRQTTLNQFMDLWKNGLYTYWMSQQKYASLNPHCKVGIARNLRKNSEQLEEEAEEAKANNDPFTLQIIADLLQEQYEFTGDSGEKVVIVPKKVYEDGEIVLRPEIFNLNLFGGFLDTDLSR
jgi:hypothetical protein